MRVFKDSEGRKWELKINVAQLKRVRDQLKIDLFGSFGSTKGSEALTTLMQDIPSFVDVLYLLCLSQAEDRKISDEAFGEAMCGDAIEACMDAFMEELIDFFPGRKMRETLRLHKARVEQMAEQQMTQMLQELQSTDTDSPSVAPASSASTQAS